MRGLSLLFLLLMVGTAFGQSYQEELQVILRESRVHVVDGRGVPVRGLTAEDFVLTENGKRQTLTYFEEVDYEQISIKPGQIIQEVTRPRRNAVLVMDTSDMAKADFEQTRKSLATFIENDLTNDDFVKLIQLDGQAISLTRFTSDKQVLLDGLAGAKLGGKMKRQLLSLESEIVTDLPEFNRLQTEINRWQQVADSATGQQRQAALNRVAQLEVERDARSRSIDSTVQQKELLKANHYRSFFLNMQYIARMLAPMDGTRSIFMVSGGLYTENDPEYSNTGELSERLGSLLNSNKITIYSIQAATRQPSSEAMLRMNASAPVNIENLQNISNLRQEYSKNYTGPIRNPANTVLENNRHNSTGIRAAAEMTGGSFERAMRTNMDDMLRKTRSASAHFYTLGYQVDGINATKRSGLTIKLKEKVPGVKLLYGKTFAKETPYRELARDEQEVVFKTDLLYSEVRRDDLGVSWDYYLFGDGDKGFSIPVTGALPRNNRKQFDIGFAALDQHREPLDFAYISLKTVPDRDQLSFYDVLLTDERPHYIRFAVRNLETDEYSVDEFRMPAPRAAEGETQLSDLVISYDPGETMPLHQIRTREYAKRPGKKGQETTEDGSERVTRDPLRLKDREYRPNGFPRFAKPGFLDVFFKIENLPDPDPKLMFQFMVSSDEGIFAPKSRAVYVERIDEDTLFYHCRVDVERGEPGFYDVWIRVIDHKTGKQYKSNHAVEFVSENEG